MALKHNRKRNSGLIYEFLVRRLSEKMMVGDVEGVAKTLEITKKYFSPGTPIHSELELFEAITKNRGVPEATARRIIGRVRERAKKLDRRAITIKKSNLIKELNYGFGQDFFSKYRIAEYKALASVQVMIDSVDTKVVLTEDVELVKIEEAIVSYMSAQPTTQHVSVDPDHDTTTYTLAVRKFQEKYDGVLTGGQKRLIESYVSGLFSGDFKKFKEIASEDRRSIHRLICESAKTDTCRSDSVLIERMSKAANVLREMKVTPSEDVVEQLMLFHDLSTELKSNG